MMVAALYVARGGSYWDLPHVDAYDIERDARNYAGPWPVVAHPECSRWSQLAHINQKRYGHKVGDDGGLFAHALASVRRWGGVLEHPAFSYAWPAFQLQRPRRGSWQRTLCGGWVTEVSQVAYGHPGRKRTWLYAVCESVPALDWSEPAPRAQVSFCKNHGNSPLPRLSKKAAKATPPAFRDLLLSIARSVQTAPHTASIAYASSSVSDSQPQFSLGHQASTNSTVQPSERSLSAADAACIKPSTTELASQDLM